MTTPSARDDGAKAAAIFVAAIGLCFALAAFVIDDARTSLSVAIGAVLAVANLLAMRAIVSSLVVPPDGEQPRRQPESAESAEEAPDHAREGRRGGIAWGVFAVFKILLLFGGIWVLLARKMVDPIPLVIGFGALPLGIAASALVTSLSPRNRHRS